MHLFRGKPACLQFPVKGQYGQCRGHRSAWGCVSKCRGVTQRDLAVGSVLPALSGMLLPASTLRMLCIFTVAWLKRSPSLALQWPRHISVLEENDVSGQGLWDAVQSFVLGKFPLALVQAERLLLDPWPLGVSHPAEKQQHGAFARGSHTPAYHSSACLGVGGRKSMQRRGSLLIQSNRI